MARRNHPFQSLLGFCYLNFPPPLSICAARVAQGDVHLDFCRPYFRRVDAPTGRIGWQTVNNRQVCMGLGSRAHQIACLGLK